MGFQLGVCGGELRLQRFNFSFQFVQLRAQLFGRGLLLGQLRIGADVARLAGVPLILHQNQPDDRGDEQHDQCDQPYSVLAVHAKSLLINIYNHYSTIFGE